MVIKRPITPEQKDALAHRDLPSEADQLQAIKDAIDFFAIKIGELEDRQHANLSALQPKFDYTC